jgi:diaminohydroxyphosphoribosylaminopyrimidine deaminase/5-amino-6-(5-phosphoribosylamino)uracil reductase
MALSQAGSLAKGAQAYVSLEPCAHHGRTPPCAQALVDAGIARVIYPFNDPDDRVNGAGQKMLEDNNIEVERGLCEAQAKQDLAGFISRVKLGRPHITLKLAVSKDGMIAQKPGETTKITGPLAHARSHLMRAKTDAIMVGINTVLADDPQLTCRLEGLEDRSPVRVIVDTHGRLPLTSNLVKTAHQTPVWLLVGDDMSAQHITPLEQAGVTIIKCPTIKDRIDLKAAFKALGTAGLTSILVEGGAEIANTLIEQDLADEVILMQSTTTIGAQGLAALGDLPLETIRKSENYQQIEQMTLADDQFTRYIRGNSDLHTEHV